MGSSWLPFATTRAALACDLHGGHFACHKLILSAEGDIEPLAVDLVRKLRMLGFRQLRKLGSVSSVATGLKAAFEIEGRHRHQRCTGTSNVCRIHDPKSLKQSRRTLDP